MSRLTLTARQGLHTHRTETSAPARRAPAPRRIAGERSRTEPPTGTMRLTATVAIFTLAAVLIVAALVDLRSQARRAPGWATGSEGSRPARTWRWRSSCTTCGRSWACSGCC